MNKLEWHTEKRRVKDLQLFEGNPRMMTKKQAKDLLKSLQKFNLVEIPVIDQRNRILAGNMRIGALKKMGKENEIIEVRVPSRELTEDEAREYLLRSNKNVGSWDYDLLANLDEELLSEIGFSQEELDKIFQLSEEYRPELPITAKLYESYNYVLIYTTNIIDQTFLENFFQLQMHQSYKSKKQGITRVVSFQKFLEALERYKNENSNTV